MDPEMINEEARARVHVRIRTHELGSRLNVRMHVPKQSRGAHLHLLTLELLHMHHCPRL